MASPISNKIRTLRFMRDETTQQELADLVGVSRQTIVAIEKGNYSPSLELAFRIANVFEQPITDVFSYDASKDHDLIKKLKRKDKK